MLDLKSIICAGYSCMLHLQAMAEEVKQLLGRMFNADIMSNLPQDEFFCCDSLLLHGS